MVSPRSQFEILETSFEDVFPVQLEPQRIFKVLCGMERPRAFSDSDLIRLQNKRPTLSDGSTPGSDASSVGLNRGFLGGGGSPISLDQAEEMPAESWDEIGRQALAISCRLKSIAEQEADTADNWFSDAFDLRSSCCPWETCLIDLPPLDLSQEERLDPPNLRFVDLFNDKIAFNESASTSFALDLDDSLTGGVAGGVAGGGASYTVAPLLSPPLALAASPLAAPATPAAGRNSSFSQAADKFHSLRRSMSSDSFLPLSQEKLSGLALSTRPLLEPPTAAPVVSAAAEGAVGAGVEGAGRLRPGRNPPAKGPMRATLPLGQMVRAAAAAKPANSATATKGQLQLPVAAAIINQPTPPMASSTPLRTGTAARRSISPSPVRRSSSGGRLSSGYGQRAPVSKPVFSPVPKPVFSPVPKPVLQVPVPQRNGTGITQKPTGGRSFLPTAMASRLKPPGLKTSAGAKATLSINNPNVPASELRAPFRSVNSPLRLVRGKENRC